MELKQIKELMAAMERTGMKRLVVKKEGIELELERENWKPTSNATPPALDLNDISAFQREIASRRSAMITTTIASGNGEMESAGGASAVAAASSEHEGKDTKSQFITSPMVGTFYASPSPEDPTFVKVGDRIEKDTVVCIIEAMKVMNEVKSGVSGVVVEVLAESGHPVEFGSKLFRII